MAMLVSASTRIWSAMTTFCWAFLTWSGTLSDLALLSCSVASCSERSTLVWTLVGLAALALPESTLKKACPVEVDSVITDETLLV